MNDLPLSDNIKIDDVADVVTIFGIKYSGSLFRGLGFETPPGQSIKILKREDGVLTMESVGCHTVVLTGIDPDKLYTGKQLQELAEKISNLNDIPPL